MRYRFCTVGSEQLYILVRKESKPPICLQGVNTKNRLSRFRIITVQAQIKCDECLNAHLVIQVSTETTLPYFTFKVKWPCSTNQSRCFHVHMLPLSFHSSPCGHDQCFCIECVLTTVGMRASMDNRCGTTASQIHASPRTPHRLSSRAVSMSVSLLHSPMLNITLRHITDIKIQKPSSAYCVDPGLQCRSSLEMKDVPERVVRFYEGVPLFD